MKNYIASLLIFLAPLQLCAEERATPWYHNFIFEEPSFTYEFIRTLGYTATGGADIGECIATARAVKGENIYSWKDSWEQTAERIERAGTRFKRGADTQSAVETYLRASNYYRTAGFFLVAPQDRKLGVKIWQKSVDSFAKASAYLPYISKVSIPYKNTSLPGYLLKAGTEKAPLLIVHSGFDGTKEELFFAVGNAAHERGYNVLLFEGPGQGEMIKKQGLPFRYDWEEVVTPVVDYAMQLDFIDQKKIALMGISLGGYLAARAAAFEPRLAACVLNGGIYDFSACILQTLPLEVQKLLDQNPQVFNQVIQEEMSKNMTPNWFFNNAMWTLKVKTPAEVIKTFQLYTLKDVVQKIQCPTLVIDSVGDTLFEGQPQQVYKELKCRKTLLKFSSETMAEAHCQVGAIMISNEEIFAWLDRALSWQP